MRTQAFSYYLCEYKWVHAFLENNLAKAIRSKKKSMNSLPQQFHSQELTLKMYLQKYTNNKCINVCCCIVYHCKTQNGQHFKCLSIVNQINYGTFIQWNTTAVQKNEEDLQVLIWANLYKKLQNIKYSVMLFVSIYIWIQIYIYMYV